MTQHAQISIEDIRQWAQAQPAHEVLGRAAMAGDCPVANYLKSLVKAPWRVDSFDQTATAGSLSYPLDEQVYRLTARMDGAYTKGKPLTARHVLHAIHGLVD